MRHGFMGNCTNEVFGKWVLMVSEIRHSDPTASVCCSETRREPEDFEAIVHLFVQGNFANPTFALGIYRAFLRKQCFRRYRRALGVASNFDNVHI